MTLAQWQRRFPQSRVPFEQALAVLRPLVDAFHDAHLEDREHGEVAASAIQVEQNPDGSLSVRLDGSASAEPPDDVSGARRYQAPECWWGARQSSYTDQYALAALFVELVTGAVPFAEIFATGDAALARTAVCNHPPKLPGDCPRREAVLRALSKDPRLRFRSCGEFLMALSFVPGASASPAGHHHHGHHRHHGREEGRDASREQRPRRRKPSHAVRNVFLAALVLGGAAAWAVRSGWYARAVHALRAGQAPADGNAQRKPATPADHGEEARQKARLVRIEAEIRQQREAADRALADLRDFLEKGGAGLLGARRDAAREDVGRLKAERTALEAEIAAAQRLEEALGQLRVRAVPYDAVSSRIPSDSEVAQSYASLGAAARKIDELTARFTEKHPEVARQKQVVEEESRRYFKSVESMYRHVQGDRTAKVRRFTELGARLEGRDEELAALERECQVARLKQDELERARAREAERLAELRQMEVRLRFGAGAPVDTPVVTTNAPAAPAPAP